jgi:hypothetical protein
MISSISIIKRNVGRRRRRKKEEERRKKEEEEEEVSTKRFQRAGP